MLENCRVCKRYQKVNNKDKLMVQGAVPIKKRGAERFYNFDQRHADEINKIILFKDIIELLMKKSLAVGLLASYGLADKIDYSDISKLYGDQPIINVPTRTYPSSGLTYRYSGIPSGTSRYSADQAIFNAINSARGTIVSTDRSIDSLFLRLPSSQELDQLILNSDSVAILKTIQTVATDDSLTCDQRISYLQQILGRIRSAVEKKQFAADQLIVIIDGARSEITRLETEVSGLEDKIKNLWLQQLYDNLKEALAKLETLYRRFNEVERVIQPKQATLQGYRRQILIIQSASDAERNRISNDKLKLTESQARIRDLENQLAAARQRRGVIEASIINSQRIIRENEAKILVARENIEALEVEIDRLQDETDRLRAKYSDIEIQVQRLRTEISIAETKADAYRDQIAQLQDRITLERQKIVDPELDRINEMIETLKRMIPTAQRQIDRHYYYCYGEGSVVTQTTTGGVVVYIVQGERFRDYLSNNYGSNVFAPGQNLGVNDKEVRFSNVNIFGDVWTSKFGYPFPKSSLGGNSDQFDIAGSFNCLNPSRTVQGSGRVHSVGPDYIEVDNANGGRQSLYLGACSRLEAVSSVPQVGQRIAYSAVPAGKSNGKSYNLYKGSCW